MTTSSLLRLFEEYINKSVYFSLYGFIFLLLNFIPISVSGQYNFYRGTFHAHTAYSDGDQDNLCPIGGGVDPVTCVLNVANNSSFFDFQGNSDHNHSTCSCPMNTTYFADAIAATDAWNIAHPEFTAMYGIEFGTISGGGHGNVFGLKKLLGWQGSYDIFVNNGDYATIFSIVDTATLAFAHLAHPVSSDYSNIYNIPYNAVWDNAITTACMKNGPATGTGTIYASPPTTTYQSLWWDLLSKGYHLAPTMDMDNHNSNTMGRTTSGRTVVLALALTYTDIMQGIRSMRIYASDDYNTDVTYKANSTYWLGSIVSDVADPSLSLEVVDPDGEVASTISLYYGVPGSGVDPTVLTSATTTNTHSYTHSMAVGETYYYYYKITQPDGDDIYTAPIWWTKTLALPVNFIEFHATKLEDKTQLLWMTAMEKDNMKFEVEISLDGKLFSKVIATVNGAINSTQNRSYTVVDHEIYNGSVYYRIKQTDFNGQIAYSEIICVSRGENREGYLYTFYPNPANDFVKIDFYSSSENKIFIRLYDMSGKVVTEEEHYTNQNLNTIYFDISKIPSGVYRFDITGEAKNARSQHKKLIIY